MTQPEGLGFWFRFSSIIRIIGLLLLILFLLLVLVSSFLLLTKQSTQRVGFVLDQDLEQPLFLGSCFFFFFGGGGPYKKDPSTWGSIIG